MQLQGWNKTGHVLQAALLAKYYPRSINRPLFSLGPSIVSALSVMKVGGCYNVTGLPEYSSGIGFRVDTGLRRGAIAVGRKY